MVGRDLDEVQRNLPKLGLTPEKAAVRVQAMRDAFGAEALVDDFDDLIGQMACDPRIDTCLRPRCGPRPTRS